jgi:hypothetical protein
MSSRLRMPVNRPAVVAYCLILVCAALACLCAGTAQASYYKMVLCAADNGSNSYDTATNTASGQNPSGIFSFENHCGPAPYPAGNNAFLRIADNQASGNAAYSAYGSMSWTVPPWVDLSSAGGYTREPSAFNEGWRGRFWLEGWDGSTNNVLMQGSGVSNGDCGGVCWATTSTFASHLWPFGGYGKYRRFVFELTCVRQAGCDRSNLNAVDANTMILTLNDVDPSKVELTNTQSGLLGGEWVRGSQNAGWNVSDLGSGVRFERLRIDGGTVFTLDSHENCDLGSYGESGEFARSFQPCPVGGPWSRSHPIDTATLSDGTHTVAVCSQDYGQAAGLGGSGGESCDQRMIHTDNSPPAAPIGLQIDSANPARYLSHFGARWKLASDPGSPIAKVHYEIVDSTGTVVVPERVISAENPTALKEIEGPASASDYRLRVWLEDAVGLIGPAASVAIPHDTTPPAAPQEISVTSPDTSRGDQGFDVRWRNIVDNGAPIDATHYSISDSNGNVIVGPQDVGGSNPESIAELLTPKGAGEYTLKLWLSDAEGNVGAPSETALSYGCVRSDTAGGTKLSAGTGADRAPRIVVHQGQSSSVAGTLQAPGGGIADAVICLFSRVVTDQGREYLGSAVAGPGGTYRFPLEAGPSREITARYRGDHRQLEASATVLTQVEPTLSVRKSVVHNKHKAVFFGQIPGPHNDNVLVVLQVQDGKGYRAFRRIRTGTDGHYSVAYRFGHTERKTLYKMRAQVRGNESLPYEPGNSPTLKLRVLP